MNAILGALILLAIAAAVVLLAVAAIASITRSRRRHGTSGSLSAAALEIQSLLEPEKKRAVETMHFDEEAEDEDDRLQSPPR